MTSVSSGEKKMPDVERGYEAKIKYSVVGNENVRQSQFAKARRVGRSRPSRVLARREAMFQK